MKYEIKHRYTNETIFSLEAKSLKLCVEAAVKDNTHLRGAHLRGADLIGADLIGADLRGADLIGADLGGADLRGAYLRGAYLIGADLGGADLRGAYLRGAYLIGADLRGADLIGADLKGAYLRGADLRGADLEGAHLRGADLRVADLEGAHLIGADLGGADLRGAYLKDAKGINYFLCTPLSILKDQVGKIRAYKLVTKDYTGPYYKAITYKVGKTCSVKNACKDESIQCAEGISLATLDWCMRGWEEGYKILVAEFTAKDIAAIPITTDGKFRVSKCKIIREKNLKKLGLE